MSKIFAKRLKKERERQGWTQEYLANLVGITNGAISGYERNYREPDLDLLAKIAGLLNCTTDCLLGLTDNPKEKIVPILSEEDRKKEEIKKALASLVAHDKGEFPIESGLVDTIYEEMEKAKNFHNKRKSGDK